MEMSPVVGTATTQRNYPIIDVSSYGFIIMCAEVMLFRYDVAVTETDADRQSDGWSDARICSNSKRYTVAHSRANKMPINYDVFNAH